MRRANRVPAVSWTKSTTLWCDGDGQHGDGCVKWLEVNDTSVARAETEARERGWSAFDGRHYCPGCNTKGDE